MVDRITLTGTKLAADDENPGVYAGFEAALTATVEGPLTDPNAAESDSNPRKGASKKSLTWSSSDETVAKVDIATGVVTGVKKGEATITAKSVYGKDDSEVTASIKVTVKDAPATEVSNDVATLAGVIATVASSDNESIVKAALSSDGKKIVITPVAKGETNAYGEGKTVALSGSSVALKTSAAVIPVTVAADGKVTLGTVSVTVLSPTLNLFKYSSADDSADKVTIKRADDDYVTVSAIDFKIDPNKKWADTDGAAASGFPKVDKGSNSAIYGSNAEQYVYKVVSSAARGIKDTEATDDNFVFARATFTVTPKAGTSVKLSKISGTVRHAGSDNYGIRVSVDDTATSDELLVAGADNHSSKTASFETEIEEPESTSSAFVVNIDFVLIKGRKSQLKAGTNYFEVYDVTLTFAPDDE